MGQDATQKDRQETILSNWAISLGACGIILLILESKGIISKPIGDFGCLLLLAIVALSAGLFSVITKRSPYRGGMADKEGSPLGYYFMTTIWWLTFLMLALAAIRILK